MSYRRSPSPNRPSRYESDDRYSSFGKSRSDRDYRDSDRYHSGGDRGRDNLDKIGDSLKTINWDLSKLPVFEKNFYIEHPDVVVRSDHAANKWRHENDISVFGTGVPKPVLTFEEASMPGNFYVAIFFKPFFN